MDEARGGVRFFTVAAAPVGALVAGHAAEAFGLRPTFAARGSSEETVVASSATASLIALE